MKSLKIASASALAAALSFGVNMQAHAYAYASADLSVTGGTITFIPTGTTALSGFGTCVTTSCATITAAPTTTSSAEATLNGSGPSTSNVTNAPPATTGPISITDNAFTLLGTHTTNYSWGDSAILSQQSLGSPAVNPDGTPNFASTISVRQMAEGNVIDSTLATSGGTTTSSTEFSTSFTTSGARVRFDLNAITNLLAAIVAPSTGIQAIANDSLVISITNTATNAPVFQWTVGSAPLGGATSSNPCGLSSNVSTNTPATVPFSCSGSFSAVTNDLAAGNYKLSLTANVTERVQATAVPEPASLALLGIGLLGAVGVGRIARSRKTH